VAEELFHADTQTEGRTDRHKDANNPFSRFLSDFNGIWIFYRDIRKLTKLFSISCLVFGGTDRERGRDIMNRISQFR